MSAFDQLREGLAAIPVTVARPDRWPNADSVQRARKVYKIVFWTAAAVSAVFLGVGGLSLLLVPAVGIALVSLMGWSFGHAFAEGYRDGATHAIEDATTLAEHVSKADRAAKQAVALPPERQPPDMDERPTEIQRELWAFTQPAARGQGYLYVVEFETGSIKIGQSTNPIRRVEEHQRDAWAYDVVATNVWISAPHRAYLTNEIKLMAACSRLPGSARAKREYFHGVDFESVVEIATDLASRPTPARLRRPSAAHPTPLAPARGPLVPEGLPAR